MMVGWSPLHGTRSPLVVVPQVRCGSESSTEESTGSRAHLTAKVFLIKSALFSFSKVGHTYTA